VKEIAKMFRNPKTFDIALATVFAMSAVLASAASAQPAHITAGSDSGTIKITQHPNSTAAGIQFFSTAYGEVECHEFSAEGKYTGGSGGSTKITSLTLEKVKYEKCNLGGIAATVTFGTCDYKMENGEWVPSPGHAKSDVTIGPAGCKVTIASIGCTLTVEGSQLFVGALTYTNVKTGAVEELTVHATAKNVQYTGGVGCSDQKLHTDGLYEGTLTAKAFNTSSAQVNLTGIAT
jgi:hypothetical protein